MVFFIARRFVNNNGNTQPIDYYFDTIEETEKFINNVRNNSAEERGHDFYILSGLSKEVIEKFSADT